MSRNAQLEFSDFENGQLWTFDADADDCSYAPFVPRYYDSGELDVEGSLFCKNSVQFAKGTSRDAILGLNQYETLIEGKVTWRWRVNSIEFMVGQRSLVLNIPRQTVDGTLVSDLSLFLGA